MKKGHLVVISGFSGVGKGTLVKKLLEVHPDEYALSVSATTRAPREGELDGIHYFFVSKEDFLSMIEKEELLEHACYVGNYYGTPRRYVEEKLESGRNVILEIELQGALNIRKSFPDALLLFIAPPSADELKNRLIGRGTETEEEIRKRLKRANEEAGFMDQYDYILVNDDLDTCMEQIHSLVTLYGQRTGFLSDFIARTREDLKQFL